MARRGLVVLASWLAVMAMTQMKMHAYAAPVAPDFRACHLPATAVPSAEQPLECCPPGLSTSTPTPRLFRPTAPASSSASLRLRRRAHLASAADAEKLARAYALMKALPPDDPRSFSQQANVHCAYCNSAYNQMDSSQLLEIHGNWLFCSFHRWYLYFHERILAKLLGDDDTFALPFWNHDHPNGSNIPWLFRSYDDNLSGSLRDPLHNRPDATVSIDCNVGSDDRSHDQQIQANDFAMLRALVRDASTPKAFFGLPLRQGDESYEGGGSLLKLPHNAVHVWVGNKSATGMKDMGSFYAGARDPVFYAHHAQLDRLWEIWKTIPGPGHQDITDEDYLDSEFIFYNEDAELVRVRVGDSLNITVLGYDYEAVETPWMNAVPTRCSTGVAQLSPSSTICAVGQPLLVPCSMVLERPDQSRSGRNGGVLQAFQGAEDALDLLQLTAQLDMTTLGSRIDVYVNLPEANASTSPACMELVASFDSLTPFSVAQDERLTNKTSEFRNFHGRLVELNLTGESSVIITLVPFFPVHSSLPAASEPLPFQSCSIYDYNDTAGLD